MPAMLMLRERPVNERRDKRGRPTRRKLRHWMRRARQNFIGQEGA